ncbi:hypothetical protein ACWCRG_43200, partial [Streptomyces formicae]
LGDGQMAGLNNAVLAPHLSPGFEKVDIAGGGILEFTDGGILLIDTARPRGQWRKLRIEVDSTTPEFRVESRRETLLPVLTAQDKALAVEYLADLTDPSLPLAGRQQLRGKELARNRIRKTLENGPDGKCEKLMEPVADYMDAEGFTGIKYRGMAIWQSATVAIDKMPDNHYVVLGMKNGRTYVFDLSAGQFQKRGMRGLDGPIITTEEQWAQTYRESTGKLIKYKDFKSPTQATTIFGRSDLPPTEFIPDATVLTTPNWYLRATGS